ncbi:geranylgeranyl transferase type-2 subunit alpha [Adelges cooleyi]|uniref:geranylgeranyl transferase type-2 subunit alpha n=1 Tax=Adelges cooleyi TaxID=133065 RepID=UPI002180949F|nr:geranylgeranyl transferase type-2 subunit alpha [Adelges cooleyi]
MHNRLKVQTTEAQKAQENREKERRLKWYQKGISEVFKHRSIKEYDELALQSSEGLLRSNPDLATLWNYRKEILLVLKPSKELINEELYLTEKCLQVNPKSYSAWFHRNWVLDNVDPEPDWHKELTLCTKYLRMDERNFHCWDYRQIVASKCQEPNENELQFTMEMINLNFSNYSAWHYRSKLISAAGSYEESTKHSELSLVLSAAFTEPSDQSAWIYQRWLIGKLEPSIYIYQTCSINNNVFLVLNRCLPKHYNIKGLSETDWSSFDLKVWYNKRENNDLCVEILNENNQTIDKASVSVLRNRDIFNINISAQLKEILNAQIESLNQLIEMEPESKWVLLTYVLLLYTLKPENYFEKCLANLSILKKIDKLRKNYYCDLESRYRIEHWISNTQDTKYVNLRGYNLTAFYHINMFISSHRVDFGDNDLSNSNLQQLKYLLSCKDLSLRNCNLNNLKGFPDLPCLDVLDLRENNLQENSFNDIIKCKALKQIILDKKQTPLVEKLQTNNTILKIEVI